MSETGNVVTSSELYAVLRDAGILPDRCVYFRLTGKIESAVVLEYRVFGDDRLITVPWGKLI